MLAALFSGFLAIFGITALSGGSERSSSPTNSNDDPTLPDMEPSDPIPSDPVLTVDSDALLAMTNRAFGLDDPSVAIGLSGINDWQPTMQTIDLMKFSRPVLAHEGGVWGAHSNGDLAASGHLDENGWMQSLPEESSNASYFFAAGGEEYEGSYVLQYEGTGDFSLIGPGIKVTSSEPGRIEFTKSGDESFWINVSDPDVNDDGDYLRDISIVREEHLELFEAGAVFNPDYIDVISDLREVRFLGWERTNNSKLSEWSDRATMESSTWTTESGAPIEAMVQLANEAGVDMWLTMPLYATEEYIQNAAIYVRDNLDPELRVTVELSNELWHANFQQAQDIWKQAEDDWGVDPNDFAAKINYTAKVATENALIWKEVFEDEPEGRLEATIATHAANTWWTERLLEAEAWFENEPDVAVSPADVFDTIAITTYFGSDIVVKEDSREGLLNAIEDPDVDAFKYLYDQLMDENVQSSLPDSAEIWRAQAEIAETYGLKLTAYEGGQHVHHTFATGLTSEQQIALGGFLQDFVRSPEMADLYEELWEVWQDIGDGPFMQSFDVGRPSHQGSWGLLSGLDDTNLRAEVIFELNQEQPWWEDRGGEHFQQGVIEYGDNEANLLLGTNQEDYLIGRDGHDILVGGYGDDGLHGGEGSDLAVFGGDRSEYDIVTSDEGGYDVVHAEGTDSLFEVEYAMFNDQVLALEDMTVVDFEDLPAAEIWEILTAGQSTYEENAARGVDELEEDISQEVA